MPETPINLKHVLDACETAAKKALRRYAAISTGSANELRSAPTENVVQVLLAGELAETRLRVECEVQSSVAFKTLGIPVPVFPKTKNPRFDIVGFTRSSQSAKYFIEVKGAASVAKLETEYRAKLLPTLRALKRAPQGRAVIQVAITKACDSKNASTAMFKKNRGTHATLERTNAVQFICPDSKTQIWVGIGVYRVTM